LRRAIRVWIIGFDLEIYILFETVLADQFFHKSGLIFQNQLNSIV
jgi:hypothetical protein